MKDNKEKIGTLLNRGVEEIIVREHLEKELESGKKLRIKFGIDPTAPDLHLGHTVVLRKLREFQNLGHKIVLIIGDFTARIGDPSGRSETRKTLSAKEIQQNLKNYLKQVAKVLDVKKCEVRYNSEWLEKKGLDAFLVVSRAATIQQVLKRADFQKRIEIDSDISLLEVLYPVMQGYDSVEIKADVELGGTDQKFNLLMGRRVQRHFNMREQDIMTVPLLEGTDGEKKMSKSFGNYIALEEKPNEMLGKIMSIPDKLIEKYFMLLTNADLPKSSKPYESKLLLAETIVAMYHGENAGKSAREEFRKVFSKKEISQKLSPLKIENHKITIVDLLIRAGIKSKSEARRLIKQNAVEINGGIKTNPEEILHLHIGDTVKIGKKKFFRIL